ncbi:sugar ABC transporter ATP-binding protein [Kaistia algarum]|uniref:sugar ABC transporter ATP-binding protein n=1 Tax=Kaistia algarum TaxID=2083279 RepID=UPI000CE72139|nr:sugar ABC transporter ATP-binding protein [Kaistia algarum]MCX5515735.1 sugar ABC transporter ATP-binding protein [Kaistia algarum]PPE80890.1 sugar ABC transporter ATP-binding protein [Kaistia algarum]
MDTSTPLLELRSLTKSFAGVRVLSSVDLTVRPGEVHALIGQNGSGKSTLIKILSGYHAPDSGEVFMRGEPVPLPMRQSARRGLRFLHQDVGVVRTMTVLENLRIGRFRTTAYGRLRWAEERRAAKETLAEMQLDIDPDTLVRDIPPAERALIGFMRAIQEIDYERGEVLILDEPTAFLPVASVEKIFKAVRNVARRGSAVVFVSHRLDEILDIADRTSILRDGRLIETVVTKETNERKLVAAMLGRELDSLYPKRSVTRGRPMLEVESLSGRIASGVSFTAHQGEILGLTGLLGMGHDEIPYLLFGASQAEGGTVSVADQPLAKLSPEHAIAAKVAFLPADRHRQSGIPKATVLENVVMTNGRRFVRNGILRHQAERTSVQDMLERFDVRPAAPDRLLATLSGGNQQKALLGKWLQTNPAVLLLHEPTQGVDIGSRQQILQIIAEVAASGTTVIMASSEYEELAHLCHRVLIFRHGAIARELTGENLTQTRIAEQCYLA